MKLFKFLFTEGLQKNYPYSDECREYKVKRNVANICKSYSRGQLGLGLQRISQRILPQLYKPGKRSIGTLEYRYEIFQNTLGQVWKNL